MKRFPALPLFALVGALSPALTAAPTPAPLHLPDMPLHDPWILAHEPSRTYYLYTSNRARQSGVTGVGTMAYTSKNLRDWAPAQTVFLVPPTAIATQGAWAPEVHEYQGRYYLFTTLHNEARVLAAPPQSRLRPTCGAPSSRSAILPPAPSRC